MASEVTIWTDASRVELIAAVLDLMGSAVVPIGVGGPRVAEVARLASGLECENYDDLRKMLVDRPSRFVLLGHIGGVTREDLRTAMAQGSTVLSIEPVAASFDDLPSLSKRGASSGAAAGVGRIVRVPDLRQSIGWVKAAEPTDILGAIRSLAVWSLGPTPSSSLYARLFEAWQLVLSLSPLPTLVNAALTGPLTEAPEQLRAVTGHLCVQSRSAGDSALPGSAAIMYVSDRAGLMERRVHIAGDSGQLVITDLSYHLYDDAGKLIDAHHAQSDTVSFADLIAGHWRRLLDNAPGTQTADNDATALACCMATLLSARTAQPESPRAILDMHHRG